MDDFLAELEQNFSNVGSTKLWKKQIGDTLLWLAPITLYGQEKVTELLGNADSMGMNIINETKRITLSFTIVGINEVDLREYRDNVPRFPITGKDGKPAKVTLDRYIFHKMQMWSAQFMDDAFSILADLVETEQKENLKNIKFENAKDPAIELIELENRVNDIRASLNKPSLVEKTTEPSAEPSSNEFFKAKAETPPAPVKDVVEVDFDPFARIASSTPSKPAVMPSTPQVQPASPDQGQASPVLDKIVRDKDGNPVNAYVSNPSIPNEILESPKSSSITASLIDPPAINRNPRFSPPIG